RTAWNELPRKGWEEDAREIKGLKGPKQVCIGYPPSQASQLTFASAESFPAGLYELKLTLRPSHTSGAIAFHSSVRIEINGQEAADLAGIYFARIHQPETRSIQFIHRTAGPLEILVSAVSDSKVCERIFTVAKLKSGGPVLDVKLGSDGEDEDEDMESTDDLEFIPHPGNAFYYVMDKAELQPLSRSGHISAIGVNKVRYVPGETLTGSITLEDVGGKGKQAMCLCSSNMM
ncbi:MAG: hypothetical protein QF437_32710, partial [Planctomycetota bacterium]|nr:hypothetical protein [Planctomycetota bacterium]